MAAVFAVTVVFADTGTSSIFSIDSNDETVQDLEVQIEKHLDKKLHEEFQDQAQALEEQGKKKKRRRRIVLLMGKTPNRKLNKRAKVSTVFANHLSNAAGPPKVYCFANLVEKEKGLESVSIAFRNKDASPCLHEIINQGNGLKAAINNMMFHFETSKASFDKLKISANKVQADLTTVCGKSLEENIQALGKVMIPTEIIEIYQQTLRDPPGPGSTLLDCVKQDSLNGWVGESERLQKTIEKIIKDLDERIDLDGKIAKGIRDSKFIEESIAFAQELEMKVGADSKGEQREQKDDRVFHLRNEMHKHFQRVFSEISGAQTKTFEIEKKIVSLKQGLNGLRAILKQVKSVQHLPEVFDSTITEIQRRNEFKKVYFGRMQEMAEELAKLCEEENSKREEFDASMGRLLPPGLIPGIDESNSRVPKCDLVQKPFDKNLPKMM